MLLIPCPWCGPRAEIEFTGGVQSGRIRPLSGPDGSEDPAEWRKSWTAYLYQDANAPEKRLERWCHSYGCGQWFLLIRDTGTGQIGKASRLTPPQQEPPTTGGVS